MNRKEEIQRLYKLVLGREADDGGLNHYLNSTSSLYEIQKALCDSNEFRNKFKQQAYEPTALDNKLPIFIVNLERRPDRKFLIESKLADLGIKNYEIIKAVDGERLSEDLSKIYNKEASLKIHRQLSKSEVACSLSHVEIAKRIIDNNLDYAIALEDDAEFTISFKHFIQNFDLEPNKFDFLMLGWFSSNEFFNTKLKSINAPYSVVDRKAITYLDNPELYVADISIHKAYYPSLYLDFIHGTHAYVMSNAGARKLVELNYPVTLEADNIWNYHVDKCKTLFTYPMLVNSQFEDSDIREERSLMLKHVDSYSDEFKRRVNHIDFGA